jgi:hypothetical protein
MENKHMEAWPARSLAAGEFVASVSFLDFIHGHTRSFVACALELSSNFMCVDFLEDSGQ